MLSATRLGSIAVAQCLGSLTKVIRDSVLSTPIVFCRPFISPVLVISSHIDLSHKSHSPKNPHILLNVVSTCVNNQFPDVVIIYAVERRYLAFDIWEPSSDLHCFFIRQHQSCTVLQFPRTIDKGCLPASFQRGWVLWTEQPWSDVWHQLGVPVEKHPCKI